MRCLFVCLKLAPDDTIGLPFLHSQMAVKSVKVMKVANSCKQL